MKKNHRYITLNRDNTERHPRSQYDKKYSSYIEKYIKHSYIKKYSIASILKYALAEIMFFHYYGVY